MLYDYGPATEHLCAAVTQCRTHAPSQWPDEVTGHGPMFYSGGTSWVINKEGEPSQDGRIAFDIGDHTHHNRGSVQVEQLRVRKNARRKSGKDRKDEMWKRKRIDAY